MRRSVFIAVLAIFLIATSGFASHSTASPSLLDVGMFTPEPAEICRALDSETSGLEDIEFCSKDEVVMLDGMDYQGLELPELEPVSVELTSYKYHKRAVKAVERSMELYTGVLRQHFERYLSRSGKYIGMMKKILREEGIPEDMAYLPIVESGFNNRAYSRSRASGPWQFIAATGKRYGLRVDWWLDERRDPVKSTRAAARYLKDLYGMFDSWSLAMAAYNAGEYRIKKALRRTRSKDYWGLLSSRHIRRETKNYVPNFIAARTIAVSPEDYGFRDIEYQEPFVYDEVELESPLTLDIVARCAETTVAEIKELNPELRRWSTPPHIQGYKVKIPRGMREKFLANLSKIPEGKRFTVKVYRVKRGDTVSRISEKTGVPQRVIISYNKLNRRGFITVGQRLLVPLGLMRN